MGGGGVMRTAERIAGVARFGFRGGPSVVHPAEQSLMSTSRPSSAAAVISSKGSSAVSEVGPPKAAAQWEFKEGGDLVMADGELMPRVVFGSVPSFQETKEAITDLKDAIDKIYLSSNSSLCEGSSPGSQVSVLSPTYSEPEAKSCVIEAISNPSVPKHALQAFRLFSTSPEVQTVVASLACDPNMWKAAMQNPELNNFLQSNQTVACFEAEETPGKVEEENCAANAGKTPEKVEALPESKSGYGFFHFDFRGRLKKLKLTVTESVSSMSNFLQNKFPTPENEKPSADADGNTETNFMENKSRGERLMRLALLVIMVVLLKRAF